GGGGWAGVVDRGLEREVPRHDRADHARRLSPDLARRELTRELDDRVAEIRLPRIGVDQLGGIRQRAAQRRIQLRPVGDQARAADLEDQLLAELFLLRLQRLLKLLEAVLAKRA